MMEKVDVKKEMDELFAHCADVVVYFGTFTAPHFGNRRMAMVRAVIPKDEPVKPWPPELTYRRAVMFPGGLDMIAVFPPKDIMNPWAAVEYEEPHGTFLEAAEREKAFVFEIWSPTKKRVAIYLDEKLHGSNEFDLTSEDYQEVVDGRLNTSPESTPHS